MQRVAVAIVTYNSALFIRRCLEYVLSQDYQQFEVIVVDNASTDETRVILGEFADRIRAVFNSDNIGFAAGQNQAIGLTNADWILTLNPDVRLTPSFVSKLLEVAEIDTGVGSVCGKLLSMRPDFSVPENPIFDSTGIYFTPALRHFDRGSGLPDNGQYECIECVFGGTGAAALYRRKMIDDISIDGEFFDSDFFAYREDADVAWRAQLLGWKCLYTPFAVAYHLRRVLPSSRRSVSSAINMHSVKNRWLMRIKNMTPDLYRRHWLNITLRDLLIVGACLLREFSSLPAFFIAARLWPKMWEKRQQIMKRRRVSHEYMAGWFSSRPTSHPLRAACLPAE